MVDYKEITPQSRVEHISGLTVDEPDPLAVRQEVHLIPRRFTPGS
ncbi:MAG: hypothetical protein Q8R13_00580 [bacterium]|nr:hypothetical protein [bacterium]MDZ4295827.1 hypothetical protein [Patescibacteria group bacterium]